MVFAADVAFAASASRRVISTPAALAVTVSPWLAGAPAVSIARNAAWPSRPIRIVVPLPPGEVQVGVEILVRGGRAVGGEHDTVSVGGAAGGLRVLAPGAVVGQTGGTAVPLITVGGG